ncbi:uncharacterized protein LOC123555460 [Mercenaria mercenaria]|uniref:uncharacterized protein LOC123555460 n=1 Tax=Mercenaria mercenaria TaxID=6596 RepID=UPI00234EB7C2|nr:uncharacterized protein LOC123555460 [Mercenaria mercenaria]
MDKLHILFMNICLLILPTMNYIQCIDDKGNLVSIPDCVEGATGIDLVAGDRGKITFPENNTSTSCKIYCRSLRYTIAGTKDMLCVCAETLQNDLKTATCDYKCPGDKGEVCGGENGISLYKIGLQNTETTVTEVTTITEKIETTVMPIQTQSRTELSSIKTRISTEKLLSDFKPDRELGSSQETDETEGIQAATVLYTALPVVIIVSGVIALVICLIVRRRQVKSECNVSYHTNGSKHSLHTSESSKNSNNENVLEKHVDNKTSTKQHTNKDRNSADCDTEYSRVVTADSPQAVHTYDRLKAQPDMDLTISAEYSHIIMTKTNPNTKFNDNTYAHIGNGKLRIQSTETGSEGDSTYNTLQASPQKHVAGAISKSESDQDRLYDHAKADW